MKTTKGGKVMNPTDAYRKELRKKELKRNKKERKKVREVGILKKDPEAIREQIRKLEMMKADGALDKTRRHKKRQLEDTLNLVLKKRKEYEEKMREKGEEPIMFSHLPAPRRRTAEEEAKQPRPEDSVYYHPTLNPTGAPPPGKPPMYKSSVDARIPVAPEDEEGDESSDREAAGISLPPPPPPPPPLPAMEGSLSALAGQSIIQMTLPVPVPPPPPPPPAASRPTASSLPPIPPPKIHNLPPPPPPPRPVQVPPSGDSSTIKPPGTDDANEKAGENAGNLQERGSFPVFRLPPLPPPLPPPPSTSQDEKEDNKITDSTSQQPGLPLPAPPPPPLPPSSRPVRPPPPPPPRLSSAVRPHLGPVQQSLSVDAPLPGVSRLPPPPPPLGLRPPLPPPPRMLSPGIPPPPGLLPQFRPLVGPPFPPPLAARMFPLGSLGIDPAIDHRLLEGGLLDDSGKDLKPSYVKSAAPTVVKRPLAQHNPELTSMVPASVLVRRETVQKVPKVKPKSPVIVNSVKSLVSAPSSAAAHAATNKPQSIDDSYSAFLEDMKQLGAFDEDML